MSLVELIFELLEGFSYLTYRLICFEVVPVPGHVLQHNNGVLDRIEEDRLMAYLCCHVNHLAIKSRPIGPWGLHGLPL